MLFKLYEDMFIFEKNEEFLQSLIKYLDFGAIKEYPHFYLLENVPEIIFETDYDFLIIDNDIYPWSKMLHLTKDRIKASIYNKSPENNEHVKIEEFYRFKYNTQDVYEFFKRNGENNNYFSNISFIEKCMGFEFINLRADYR